jgi:dienelactone hydrolase
VKHLLLALLCAACSPSGPPEDPDGASPPSADAAPVVDAAPPADLMVWPGDAGPPSINADTSGSYGWGTRSATVAGVYGDFGVTVYTPSDDGGATVATRGAPFPLVVVSPGASQASSQYASLATFLASWGYLVAIHQYDGLGTHEADATQVGDLISWMKGEDSGLAGSFDGVKIASVGHSLGGKIAIYAAALDPRIDAVVAWDPVDSGSPSVAPEEMADVLGPVAVLGETLDSTGSTGACAPAAENYTQYYAAAYSPALAVTFVGADHMDWVDDTACAVCGYCQSGSAAHAEVKALSRRITLAWIRRYLQADATMDYYLVGAGMEERVAAGKVTFEAK